MVKHEQTKGGKFQYLSPQTDVVIIQSAESLLSSSMTIPDIGEIDITWDPLSSPTGLEVPGLSGVPGGMNMNMF